LNRVVDEALGLTGARVLVVGDVMLDRYWSGGTSRISPEAPVPVVNVLDDDMRPGGAANVAVNVANLGGNATLLGVVGADDAAERLAMLVRSQGVAVDFLQCRSHPTMTKLRVVSRNQQLMRLDFERSLAAEGEVDQDAFQEHYKAALNYADVVILSDYGKGTLRNAAALIAEARLAGKPVLVDPKGNDYSPYAGATLITPNMSEFEAVAGKCASEEEIVAKGEALRRKLGLRGLLVTRSEHGMTLIQADATPLHLRTEAREVYDVTGAGDTVIATIGIALAAGKDLLQACQWSNLAAGIVVGKFGTATVSPAELAHAMNAPRGLEASVVVENMLLVQLEEARRQGKRIVFTNGCFDILHVGHIRYLEEAKRLGDVLVVGVNEDDSVRRLKGWSRPVNRCDDRMRVLAGLRSVDWVVSFGEDTPERLIRAVQPDVLVKGGDYHVEDIVGYDIVSARGGKVVALDFHDGYSTTRIIERSQQTHQYGGVVADGTAGNGDGRGRCPV
jgi:D-beta-D-heptose 7-phosphate kinase/D-beta-D-heptose 1-phosphate adenosyltransferase